MKRKFEEKWPDAKRMKSNESEFIRVGIRLRPDSGSHAIFLENDVLTLPDKSKFQPDFTFAPNISTEQVYNEAAKPYVKQFLDGFNAIVFCYGQWENLHNGWKKEPTWHYDAVLSRCFPLFA